MNFVTKTITIEEFVTLGGDVSALQPAQIKLDSNFDLSEPNIKAISIRLDRKESRYDAWTKKTQIVQYYAVKYLKKGVETVKTVANEHLINVVVEMVLHPSLTTVVDEDFGLDFNTNQ